MCVCVLGKLGFIFGQFSFCYFAGFFALCLQTNLPLVITWHVCVCKSVCKSVCVLASVSISACICRPFVCHALTINNTFFRVLDTPAPATAAAGAHRYTRTQIHSHTATPRTHTGTKLSLINVQLFPLSCCHH